MTTLLDDRFTSILQASDRDALLEGTVRFARSIGFATVNVLSVMDSPSTGDPIFLTVNNSPPASRVLDSRENGRRDLVMQHCKRSRLPIVWDRDTYRRAGEADMWDAYSAFGFSTGMALATHRPMGRHFFFAVDRDRPLPDHAQEVSRRLADLQLFAVFAEEAAARVLLPTDPGTLGLRELTPRETECLRWTMEGKTAWEVGQILGISEQTAVRHLNNATHKLDCANKHHAVVKALRLQLIS